ncbi:MAG: M13 family metallopeptidase [Bacteroidales bacterium]|jgi:putative endopeptidase|nr:M13 family metallopeptidase [Bacteroidales bacterium]MDD2617891.1 M13 family metallopeptidase [Bacteroidales bacterium]NLB03596.1 M13 family metallopeptidase [Bacteroidales bacterium]
MKKVVFTLIITGLCMSSCIDKKTSGVPGIDLTDLDTTMSPAQDFYQYACGGWIEKNPLPAEYARYGSFDQLAENTQKQLRELVLELEGSTHPEGSVAQKMALLYHTAMDSTKLNAEGAEPIRKDLEQIQTLENKEALTTHLASMQKRGVFPFFVLYVGADDMNASMNLLHTYQSGLGMGEREYYLSQDERKKELRLNYLQHVEKMFALAGYTSTEAKKAASDVMAIENRLAAASLSQEELRDPYKNYHKMSLEELSKLAPQMDWKLYFESLGNKEIKELNVAQEKFISEVAAIIKETELDVLKNYLSWNLINSAANFLSDELALQNFDFYGRTLSGSEEMRARWKRALGVINGSLGEALGQLYVEKYFPPQAKERMLKLVDNLQLSLGERINSLEWMSEETKEKALEKLSTFHVKIGYPDKWKDYSSLEVKEDSYWENVCRASLFAFNEGMHKVGKPVDKEEWLMNPQTVNAYYNPTTNEICFPAGILQPPFFNMNADDAVNYGAIGVVIGHEMTHGFDDQGRQYDKEGNLSNWWKSEDAENFAARTAVLENYFNQIEVAPGTYANGKFTLGENIADHGGLQVSFNAYTKTEEYKLNNNIDGLTPAQRFFIAYAHVWANNIREQEILRRTAEDPHSLGYWRVNGALPHIDAFVEAFKLKEGDAMYLPKEQRASIW